MISRLQASSLICSLLVDPSQMPMLPWSMSTPPESAQTNRLIHETSPYLLQHASNPVDWYPWGPEALQAAKEQNRPILLSIGYSACHWCHVMERESFESAAIAAVMNRHFICIKVDREERPDLDEIYMQATVTLNRGQGGWPMTVFLTPEQEPFFAGTYFPPEDSLGAARFPQPAQENRRSLGAGYDRPQEPGAAIDRSVEERTQGRVPRFSECLCAG